MRENIKLATRESPLALRQANIVRDHLLEKGVFKNIDIVSMTTSGDSASEKVFKSEGGKGLFLKELELALTQGKADIAVHSMKDVPAKISSKFSITSIMVRDDPRDVFISNKHSRIEDMQGGDVGSSSPRRQAILSHLGKKINVRELRGNINTRLKKLDEENFDAIVLAKAGLERMNLGHLITQSLDIDTFVPAPGQGVLCIECLSKHQEIFRKIRRISDSDTEICVMAERIFAAEMDGDCLSPIGAHATVKQGLMTLIGFVASLDGRKYIKNRVVGNKEDYVLLANKLSKLFIKMGSKRMLKC